GGGAGGSVNLTATTFAGSGTITAVGGNSGSGAGGGGRISVTYGSSTYTGSFDAEGGAGGPSGQAGTVRVVNTTANALTLQDGSYQLGASDNYSSVTLLGGAVLTVNGAATVTQPIILTAGATIVLQTSDAMTNLSIPLTFAGALIVDAPLTFAQGLTVQGALDVNAPVSAPSLTVQGTLDVNAKLSISGNLTVDSGATVTHDSGATGFNLAVAGTLAVSSGGAINVTGKGLAAGPNSGFGNQGATLDPTTLQTVAGAGAHNGASHGGLGGYNDGGQVPPNPVYGSSSNPLELGAGGGIGDCGIVGGYGGGLTLLTAGTLQLDGAIHADGAPPAGGCRNGGGGAGGSVNVTATTFAGSGTITAMGGNSGSGAGGGGRIRVSYGTTTFSGTFSATGGQGGPSGAPGTVEVTSTGASGTEALTVSNGSYTLTGSDSYQSITLGPGGVLDIVGPGSVGSVISVGAGATVILDSPNALEHLALSSNIGGTLAVHVAIDDPQDLLLSGTLVVDNRFEVKSLSTTGTAIVTHDQGVTQMNLVVDGTFDLVVGAQVIADGKGYAPGPYAGYGNQGATIAPATLLLAPGAGAHNGASHASLGGYNDSGQPAPPPVYDTPSAPLYLGGGGGIGDCGIPGGFGGGFIRVQAGAFDIEGLVSASGSSPSHGCRDGGGGAGGSLVLTVGTLSGSSGSILAQGGPSGSGGGGGGIIVLDFVTNRFTGAISAAGGAGAPSGAAGQVTSSQQSAAPMITSTAPATATLGLAYAYPAQAAGSTPIAWSLVSGPPGAAIDAASGDFSWTPSSTGSFSATIQAANGLGQATQSFTVTVQSAPKIVSTAATTASVGVPYLYDAQGTAIATGSTPLTWSASIAPQGFAVDPKSGAVSWTPAAAGSFSVCLNVANSAGSDQQCFQVAVTQLQGAVAPVISSTPPTSGAVGQAWQYTATATGTSPIVWSLELAPQGFNIDPQTGDVTWTPVEPGQAGVCLLATNPGGTAQQCFQVNVSGSTSGLEPAITSTPSKSGVIGQVYAYDPSDTATASGAAPIAWSAPLAPTGFAIDPQSGVISWVPAQAGAAGVCLQAANDFGQATQCFTVQVSTAPLAPQFSSTPPTTATVGVAYGYVAQASGNGPITFAAAKAPPGFSIGASTGAVTWTPEVTGNVDIQLTATNGAGSATQEFNVSVLPPGQGQSSPPVILHDANLVAAVGVPYAYSAGGAATAAGATPISWSVVQGPPDFHIDAQSGAIGWLPASTGPQKLQIQASNSLGQDSYAFTVNVSANQPAPPTPVISLEPATGAAPLAVQADGSKSYAAPGDSLTAYRWDFGDGSPYAYGETASHTYALAGGYVARLQVTDALGVTAQASQPITATTSDGKQPPSALIVASQTTGSDSLSVVFSCDCHPGFSPIASYAWNFGDGSQGNENTVTHLFGPGSFQVQLLVTDETGLTATDQVTISVSSGSNLPPIVIAQATPLSGAAPLEVSYLATYSDLQGQVVSVSWQFADGATATTASPTHSYATPGVQQATVTVTNDHGLTASSSIAVTVTDSKGGLPPQIVSVATTTAAVGTPYGYDPEGAPAARGDRPLTWSLGKKVSGSTVGAPAGMTIDPASGKLAWTPTAAQAGKVPVTIAVQNSVGAASQDFVVAVAGGPPASSTKASGGCACSDGSAGLELLGLVWLLPLFQRRRKRR
ncbi:MAG: beta strand repeat-containing protein, partial [Deltaproteobacteria bacterium]